MFALYAGLDLRCPKQSKKQQKLGGGGDEEGEIEREREKPTQSTLSLLRPTWLS